MNCPATEPIDAEALVLAEARSPLKPEAEEEAIDAEFQAELDATSTDDPDPDDSLKMAKYREQQAIRWRASLE